MGGFGRSHDDGDESERDDLNTNGSNEHGGGRVATKEQRRKSEEQKET